MSAQLPLDLPPPRPALGRGDFLPAGPNALALAAIDRWAEWPQGKLVLVGPEGAGKTHLAHVWAAMSGAAVVPATALAGADLPALAGAGAGAGAVAVEDAERIAGDGEAETALFHLHNLVLAAGGRLMLSARTLPRDWGLVLPDLASRVAAAGLARIAPPDDALLAAVLVKLFADRQLGVPAALIPWLVARMERSFAAAQALVAALDARALAEGRPVGRAMAAAVLDNPPVARP